MATPIAIDPSTFTPDASPTPAPVIPGFGMAGRDAAGNPIMAPSGKGPGPASTGAPYKISASDFKPDGPSTAPLTESVSQGHPYQDTAEEVARMGAFAGGGLVGGPMGAGLGGGAADVGIALLHHLMRGTPLKLTPESVSEDVRDNAEGAYAGDVIGPLIPKGIAGIGRNLIGKPALELGAKETAEAAEQTGAKAYADQAQKNLAERADTYSKTGQAVGQQRLEAGANAYQAGTQAQDALAAAKTDAEAKATQNTEALKSKVASDLQAEAKKSTIQSSLGRTPEQTTAAIRGNTESVDGVAVPGPAMVNRQTQFWDAFYLPIRKMSDALGKGYDTIFNGKDALPINNVGPLQKAVADEEGYADTNGVTYSAPAQKLLARAKSLTSAAPAEADPLAQFYSPKELAQMSPAQKASYLKMLQSQGVGRSAAQPNSAELGRASYRAEGAEIASGAEGPISAPVGQVRGLRSDATKLAASATSARDRALAHNIMDGADETLANSGVLNPKEQAQLTALNAKYRSYKTIFDRNLIRQVGSSAEPTDVAAKIFTDPKRFSLLTQNADRGQLSTLRRTYADWVNQKGIDVITPDQAPELAKLFPGTPLANPQSWIYMDKSLTRLQDVIRSSPEVQAKALRVYGEQLAAIRDSAANGMVKDAEKQLPTLGNFGQRILTQMKAAKTPQEAADIYVKGMTGTSPEQLVQEATAGPTGTDAAEAQAAQVAATQKTPEMAQREAIMNSQAPQAAKAGMAPPTNPDEAAVQAIQMGKTGKSGGYGVMSRVARNWPLYAAVSAAYLAQSKSPSPYIGGMAVLGGTMALTEGLRGMYYKSLADNPEAASQLWQAITNPGTDSNFKFIMNTAAKGAVSDAAAHLNKAAGGVSLEGPPAPEVPKGVGPAVSSLEKSRAEAIAPTPSASDRAHEVAEKLSKGKNPRVSEDLDRGRLSLEEVNRLVKHAGKGDMTAMLDHVPLSEAMDAAEVGTPDERKMLMPLIKQKMMQQFKGGNFNKTLAANLAKRYQKLASGETSGGEQGETSQTS